MDYTTNRILKVFGKRNEGPAAIDGVKAELVFPSLPTPVCPGSGQLRLTALSRVGGIGLDRIHWSCFCFVSCGYWYCWVSFSDTGSSATQTEGQTVVHGWCLSP